MYYRQPRYFGDFHCIGSACPDNCCCGWRIDWKKEEVDKLKSIENCSPKIKEIIEKAFIPNEEIKGAYKIAFDEHKRCPFLTDDSLCRIQKEFGIEYMSDTCMVYPRGYFITKDAVYCVCCSSCREVMHHLINDEKSMDLINIPIKKNVILGNSLADSPKDLAVHPELKFRGELFEFFYELIADKKHDVETNIILGALASQALTKLVDTGDIDAIPETLKSLKAQTHNGAQLKLIENIRPNYHLRFGFIEKALNEIVGFSMVGVLNDQSGTPNVEYYNNANKKLNEIFKDRPFFLRNIALNHLFEFVVPFRFKNKTIFENYSLFALAYACIKLNMIALAFNGKFDINIKLYGKEVHYIGEEKFATLTAIICRKLCQNEEIQKAILEFLKEHKFTSPAYLALLVK